MPATGANDGVTLGVTLGVPDLLEYRADSDSEAGMEMGAGGSGLQAAVGATGAAVAETPVPYTGTGADDPVAANRVEYVCARPVRSVTGRQTRDENADTIIQTNFNQSIYPSMNE